MVEPPECPICLQSYDDTTTIPRVLTCGHSACETCLTNLHHHHQTLLPQTLRCPCCTHLVKFTHAHALPKNIDLLRFSDSLSPSVTNDDDNKRKTLVKEGRFSPKIWSDELYAAWKDWVLPHCAVCRDDGKIVINSDFVGLSAVLRCFLVDNQEVGFVCIGNFQLGNRDSLFEYSYVGKIMCVLCSMNVGQRNEMKVILGVSLRNSRVCNVFGLWLDVENDGCLYLVYKRMTNGLLNLEDLGNGVGQASEDPRLYLRSIGLELCEDLLSLHSEGFVCGCLGLSCLCFDEFGHVCLDIGEALVIGRKFGECVVEGVNGRCNTEGFEAEALVEKLSNLDAFVSPEVLLRLFHREGFEMEKNDAHVAICYKSDVWLLACVLIRLIIGKQFVVEMCNYLRDVFQGKNERLSGYESMYWRWVETINAIFEPLVNNEYASVHKILLKCLDFDPRSRPPVNDVWKCIRGLSKFDLLNHFSSWKSDSMKDNVSQCLILGDLCHVSNDLRNASRISSLPEDQVDGKPDTGVARVVTVDNIIKGISAGKLQYKDLHGHRDCISGLCVGGGYLFSSSFGKTVNVWSLQIWMNDMLKTSTKIHYGAIFSLAMEAKWLFFGGWDRTVKVQEITRSGSEMEIIDVGSIACDSVITALLSMEGNLYVGANKVIKVYHCGI